MKETNLDRKRAYWLVKVPALKNQIQFFFRNDVQQQLAPSRTLLTLSTTTEKNFIISIIPFQSNMQRDACYRLHSSRLYL